MQNKFDETENILSFLAEHFECCKEIFLCTSEMKRLLNEGGNGEFIEEEIKKRGKLIDTMTSSTQYYVFVKGRINSDGDLKQRKKVKNLLLDTQKLLQDIESLNSEVMSLMQGMINNISLELEKILDGKHFASNLKKHENMDTSPTFIDING